MIKLRSLKTRIFFVTFSLVVFAIGILATIVIYTQNQQYGKNSIKELNSLGEIIGQNALPSLMFEQFEEILPSLQSLVAKENVDGAWIINESGIIISQLKHQSLKFPPNLTTEGLMVNDGFFSKTEIISEEEEIGHVIIKGNRLQFNRLTSGLFERILFSSITLLAFFAIIVFVVQKSISKPILEIVKVAKDIQNGNLKTRAPSYSTNEFKELSEAINEMINRIIFEKELSDQVLKSRGTFYGSIAKKTKELTQKTIELIDQVNNPSLEKKDALILNKKIENNSIQLTNTISDIINITSKTYNEVYFIESNFEIEDLLQSLRNNLQLKCKQRDIQLNIESSSIKSIQADYNRLLNTFTDLSKILLNQTDIKSLNLHFIQDDKNGLIARFNTNIYNEAKVEVNKIISRIGENEITPNIKNDTEFDSILIQRILSFYKTKFSYLEKENEHQLTFKLNCHSNQIIELENHNKLYGKRVLIVEPNEQTQSVIKSELEKKDVKVITATDANNLFDVLKYNYDEIDCIITEFDIPLNTFENTLTKLFKNINHLPPIIVYTSNSEDTLKLDCENLNIFSVIQKPQPVTYLINQLTEAIK